MNRPAAPIVGGFMPVSALARVVRKTLLATLDDLEKRGIAVEQRGPNAMINPAEMQRYFDSYRD